MRSGKCVRFWRRMDVVSASLTKHYMFLVEFVERYQSYRLSKIMGQTR